MEHLACFVPGNLALGVESGAVAGAKAEEYLALAAELCVACFQMYSQQPTGAGNLLPLNPRKAKAYLALAAVLCVACFQTYAQQPTGAPNISRKTHEP